MWLYFLRVNMLQDLEDNHRHFFLLLFQAGFSPMLLCSLEASHDRSHWTPGTEITAYLRPASGSVERGPSNIILQDL